MRAALARRKVIKKVRRHNPINTQILSKMNAPADHHQTKGNASGKTYAASLTAPMTIPRARSRSARDMVSGGDKVSTQPWLTLKLSPAPRQA